MEGDSNPWGAEPSYSQRISTFHADQDHSYAKELDDILTSPTKSQLNGLHGESSHDTITGTTRDGLDDDEEDFIYEGIDTSAQPSTTPDDSMSSDTYSAKMKDILGSDDDGEPEDGVAIVDVPSSPITNDAASSSTQVLAQAEPSEDGSFSYPRQLPNDTSFDTQPALPSRPSSSRIFTPRSTSGTGLSLLRQSNTMTSTPQRPVAYPSLSRLRASVGRVSSGSLALPGSPASSSSRNKIRSPLPFEFTAAANGVDDASQSTAGHRSRQSSFSNSVSGSIGYSKRRRPRASFPYGAEGMSTMHSMGSLVSDPASSSPNRLAVLGGGEVNDQDEDMESRLKETRQNESQELARDFVKWTALRRVIPPNSVPTVLAVAGGLIAIGTASGRTIVVDFTQDPIASVGHDGGGGQGDSVTALAFSSDHSFLGVGHASGNIFLYDLSQPHRAARHVPPVPLSSVKSGKREGHLSGSAIVHIGFIGLRHTAIVSADVKGLAFYHALGRILGVASNDTLRLLGRYPNYEHEEELGLGGERRSTIFQMAPLPLGSREHGADEVGMVAMITERKMVLVGLKPAPRTWYRKVNRAGAGKEKEQVEVRVEEEQRAEPGCLAWYPASTEADGRRSRKTNPILAFSFGRSLHLVRLVVRKVREKGDKGEGGMVEEVEPVELTGEEGLEEPDGIVGLQWFSPDLLMLTTKRGLALFDCREGKVTERMRGGAAAAILGQTVEQRYYDAVLLGKHYDPLVEQEEQEGAARSWAVNHSIRISKGRSFFLTNQDLIVGTLLSWADRLLLYVSQGDFLSAIELATLFHQGNFLGSAVGLPSDPQERTAIVADKLRELMLASAEYAFSPDRLTDSTHITDNHRGVDRTSLFQGLARVCARACLSLGEMGFLFDVLYDKYEENGIEGIFVGQMEEFIVSGVLREMPIPVVQRLVAFRRDREEFGQAERIIWHVDPKCLDLDQALGLCLERRLYDALIYVFNAALEDWVSPVIELLHPLRRVLGRRRRKMERRVEERREVSDPYAHIRIADGEEEEEGDDWEAEERDLEDGYRVFSYLSVILTGNKYPSQEPMDAEQAGKAKSSIYNFVFSGSCTMWPPGPGGKLVLYGLDDSHKEEQGEGEEGEHEPIYPYLRLLLEFDAEAFLDALDLAFEDGFLDDEDVVGKRISRQLIVEVLLELTHSHPRNGQESDTARRVQDGRSPRLPLVARVFVHIFIARNAPKYPQFVRLSQQAVDSLLRSLALPSSNEDEEGEDDDEAVDSTREDRELAAECLLSHYKPRFDDEWLDLFEQASFSRILRSAFRQEKKWDRLLGMYLNEELSSDAFSPREGGGKDAFSHFEETLFNAARKDTPHREELANRLHEQLSDHVVDLLDRDPLKTAALLDRFFPNKHAGVLQRLEQLDEQRLLLYLRCFFEPLQVAASFNQQPSADVARADPDHLDRHTRERYLDLLCRYDPSAVVRNLDARGAAYFDLERLVASHREAEVAVDGSRVVRNSDAIVWALDRLGRSKEAFEELDRACGRTAESLVLAAEEGKGEMLGDVKRCVDVAVRLCIERANAFGGHDDEDDGLKGREGERMETDEVWFRLLRSLVRLVHDVARLDTASSSSDGLLDGVKEIVQNTLSDLISSTAAEAVSFPALFRRLTGSSNGSKADGEGGAEHYAEIRSVLDGMLSAYHLRSELLGITNKLFDRDTFVQFRSLHVQRKVGWRPAAGSHCAGCNLLLFGPGRNTPANHIHKSAEESKTTDSEDMRKRAPSQTSQSRTPSGSLLTPLPTNHYRRAKSPYDEKAAPLASPRIDKGKGVVRSEGGINGRREGGDGVDGYFASSEGEYGRRSAIMTRSSSASSVGVSLRINDMPAQEVVEGVEGEQEEEDGDGTLTQSHFAPQQQNGNGWSGQGEGETSLDSEGFREQGERIVVQKSGLIWHESCFKRSKPESHDL